MNDSEFGEYYRLKTEGLASGFEPSAKVKRLLEKAGVPTNEWGRGQEEQMLQILWTMVREPNGTKMPAKITAISLDRIRAATSTTNSHYAILSGKVSNGLTVMQEAMEPGFHYAGQTNAVSSESAQGLFFHLSFFARSSASTNAGPVYMSLYWSEPDQNWALSRLFTDRVLNFRTLF